MPLTRYPQFDNTTLRECNIKDDCLLPEESQCNRMGNKTPSGKIGYCVPYQCNSNKDCLNIGNVCTSGVLSGTCNYKKYRGTCEYSPILEIAMCGKEYSKKD